MGGVLRRERIRNKEPHNRCQHHRNQNEPSSSSQERRVIADRQFTIGNHCVDIHSGCAGSPRLGASGRSLKFNQFGSAGASNPIRMSLPAGSKSGHMGLWSYKKSGQTPTGYPDSSRTRASCARNGGAARRRRSPSCKSSHRSPDKHSLNFARLPDRHQFVAASGAGSDHCGSIPRQTKDSILERVGARR